MFPSMETFLRRFWKLESRELAGLWQCRLAGVDMAAPSGSARGCRLLRLTLSLPPAGGRDACLPLPLPGKRRRRGPLPAAAGCQLLLLPPGQGSTVASAKQLPSGLFKIDVQPVKVKQSCFVQEATVKWFHLLI